MNFNVIKIAAHWKTVFSLSCEKACLATSNKRKSIDFKGLEFPEVGWDKGSNIILSKVFLKNIFFKNISFPI